MNVTNRAFIKAYAWDRSEPSPPAPHLVFVPVVGKCGTALNEAESGSKAAANAPVASNATMFAQAPQRKAEQTSSPVVPAESLSRPAKVTHFVPAPHLPLVGSQVQRSSQRQPLNIGQQQDSSGPTDTKQSVAEPSQPLSAFTLPETVVESFEPALGVPAFQWPETCDHIQQHFAPDYAGVHAAVETLRSEFAPVIAISGARRGEGRSTALLCLGRDLARRGLRTVMVDGDFARPSLAAQLGLETSTGWEDVLTGQILLTEAIVFAEEEGLSLLPLGETVRDRHAMASALHVTISLAVLSQHYDVVLVDTGPLCDEPSSAATMLRRAKFSGAILVHDTRATQEPTISAAIDRLAELHVPLLGVVENFGSHLGQTPSSDRQFAAA